VAIYFHRVNRNLADADNNLRRANETLTSSLEEIRELHLRLKEQAIRDPLTGLYNRRYLDDTLERELSRAKREGYPLSLTMIDLDYFKQVNDTYGHKAGDEVLIALGELLQTQAREGDIPCRYGGEEFVLVLPRMTLEVASQRAEQWREAFGNSKIRHKEFEIGITMSIGLATYPDHAATAEDLIDSADKALYNAKAAGRNRLAIAEPLPS
jgi:diguanylate cyclase (GGDEF)-like protein